MKRATTCLVIAFLILLGAGGPVHATYALPEIEDVPVERLIENMEQRLAALDQAKNSIEYLEGHRDDPEFDRPSLVHNELMRSWILK